VAARKVLNPEEYLLKRRSGRRIISGKVGMAFDIKQADLQANSVDSVAIGFPGVSEWQIPQLDDDPGARARSARVGNTLSFADIPGIFNKDSASIAFLSSRVKYSGYSCPSLKIAPTWAILSRSNDLP
jgi:hypothetical protein